LKNILLISSEFPPLPGGIGNHALNLAFSLYKEGKSVTVITNQRSKNGNEEVAFDIQLPFHVQRIKRRKIVLLTYLDRIFQAVKYVSKNKSLTLICSGKFSLWTGGISKVFFPDRKYVAVLHGSEINAGGTISKKITKWSLKQLDVLIAVSNFTKNLVLETASTLNISVINNGFSLPKIEISQNAIEIKGNPAVVTVGNVTYRKGQQNGITALPLLKLQFPEIHYHIIGIPTEKHAFELLAKSLGVDENITFHGVLSNEEVHAIVSNSKVFFMLSDTLKNGDVEGFGIAVLEANYFGLPAIGSKNTGIVDAINDGNSGKLVNQKDTNEIAIAFQEINDNYSHYSKEAKLWSKNFDWNIVIKKYLELLDK
jgi:glycosyltransferase involved in cell wall biosynthesis